jgi:hypothetical protein
VVSSMRYFSWRRRMMIEYGVHWPLMARSSLGLASTAPVKSLRTNLRLHHQLQKNMPPQRRPLAPLNNDRVWNNELGIYCRGQIEGLRKIGLPMATISRVLNILKSLV